MQDALPPLAAVVSAVEAELKASTDKISERETALNRDDAAAGALQQLRKEYASARTESDAATERYGCLVLLNTVPTNEPSECLFWWRTGGGRGGNRELASNPRCCTPFTAVRV